MTSQAGNSSPGETSMNERPGMRTRLSMRELMKEENKDKLNAFLRAWKRVKELPPDNPNSFWCIAGFHGFPPKPNQLDPDIKSDSPGFCQHGNVLFPMWHRFFVLRMEQALQTMCPDDDIAMHYWDETSEETLEHGLPSILTDEKVWIDGIEEENPLKSYIFQRQLGSDDMKKSSSSWKPEGYESKRYPHAGLVSDRDVEESTKHNDLIRKNLEHHELLVAEMNQHVKRWLTKSLRGESSTYDKFVKCLYAESYNIFSNNTSAKEKMGNGLEAPHDDIHLCIGGGFKKDCIQGASGDMAFVETASFDPIFFMHHSNIDRMFWMWQVKHNCTKQLEITHDDRGASVNEDPTPFQKLQQKLTMTTPLHPFQLTNGLTVTSSDGIDIEKLNYGYSRGSLMEIAERKVSTLRSTFVNLQFGEFLARGQIRRSIRSRSESIIFETTESLSNLKLIDEDASFASAWMIRAENFNPKLFKGSLVASLFWKNPETPEASPELVGTHSVFRRWDEDPCRNCQLRPKGETFLFDVTNLVTNHDVILNCKDFSLKANHFDRSSSLIDVDELASQCKLRLFRIYTPQNPL